MATCDLKKKNVGGLNRCAVMPGYFQSFITTPESFKVTPEQMVDKAFWQAAIKDDYAERIYLFPTLYNNTPDSEEPTYSTTPLGKRLVRPGQYEFLFAFSESLCFHKALYSHRANSGRIILIDLEGNFIGTQDSDGNFRGQSIGMFNPENMTPNTGDEVAMSPVRVRLKNQIEFNKNGVMFDASDFVSELVPLTDVLITPQVVAGGEMDVLVTIECDGTEILGLALGDFLAFNTNGTAASITGVVDNGDGTYTLTGTFQNGGTVGLADPADISLPDAAYEGAAVVANFGS
jgi:hypothetical protein